jgi:hypothetical protein
LAEPNPFEIPRNDVRASFISIMYSPFPLIPIDDAFRSVTPSVSLDKSRSKAIGVTGGEDKRSKLWLMMCLFPVRVEIHHPARFKKTTELVSCGLYRMEDQEWYDVLSTDAYLEIDALNLAVVMQSTTSVFGAQSPLLVSTCNLSTLEITSAP